VVEPGHGVTAAELAERNKPEVGELSAETIRRWLVDGNLAVEDDGRLRPTERAHQLAGALA
jgi:hypothetical protein